MSDLSANPKNRSRRAPPGYEERDANAKWIFAVVALVLVLGLIMHFSLAGVMGRFEKRPGERDDLSGARRTAAAPDEKIPHLQLAPPEDLKRFRAREESELNTYGWIDRTAGVVRIPVDRAMELVLQRGLPVRSATNEAAEGPSSFELQQKRVQDVPQTSNGAQP